MKMVKTPRKEIILNQKCQLQASLSSCFQASALLQQCLATLWQKMRHIHQNNALASFICLGDVLAFILCFHTGIPAVGNWQPITRRQVDSKEVCCRRDGRNRTVEGSACCFQLWHIRPLVHFTCTQFCTGIGTVKACETAIQIHFSLQHCTISVWLHPNL